MTQLQILQPDGNSRIVSLEGERVSVGRSVAAEISYPDDNGLSRRHLAFERDGDGWAILDLGSKNGTTLNGVRLAGRTRLQPGDRIGAGHLILLYDGASSDTSNTVVVFDPEENADNAVVTKLGLGETLAARQVSALLRAGNELAGHRPLPELFRFILDLAMETVKADRGVLMTLEDGELLVRAHQGEGFRISTAVRDRVLDRGLSVLVRDTSMDDLYRERRSIIDQNIRTLMAVPLQTRDRVIGIVYVDSPSLLREFTKDDLDLLTVMANVAAIRIEQTRFAELEQARQLLERELEQAAEIQQGLLPAAAPVVKGLDLAGYNAPCGAVGGDYYDFFPHGDSRVAVVLGDVSGKGMPASLLMMGLQARVQVLVEDCRSLSEVMTRLNAITSANCPANRFISLFLCLIDGKTGDLTYCNAGHNPPLIIKADGSYELLKSAGPVLGLLPHHSYHEHRVCLDMGHVFVIYSDGVTEAQNSAGREFEIEGLADAVIPHCTKAASEIISHINRSLASYTNGAPPSDDITLVVARRVADETVLLE